MVYFLDKRAGIQYKDLDMSIAKGTYKRRNVEGRVYVLRVVLDDGTVLHKVGMCNSSRSVDRMMEVLRGFFNCYRYVPRCELRRDKAFPVPLLVEKHLHEQMEELSYTFDKKFGGSTEFFQDVDEEVLLDYIDNFDLTLLLRHKIEMKTEDYNAICKAIKKPVDKNKVVEDTDELPF